MGAHKVEVSKEHHEHLSGSVDGSNSHQSSSFDDATLTQIPNDHPIATPKVLAEHGPLVDHQIPQADAVPQRPDLWWSRVRAYCQEPFSEFFGVFILILFGDGVVAQVVLSGGTKGSYQSISWGMYLELSPSTPHVLTVFIRLGVSFFPLVFPRRQSSPSLLSKIWS